MGEYDNYAASNSHKSKQEASEKRVEKVVTGKVKPQKKSGAQKLLENFVSEDASNVGGYIFGEVLVPAIKKALSDIVRDGIDIILYGNTSSRSGRSSNTPYVNYSRFSSDRREPSRTQESHSRVDYRNFEFENRRDAEEVLSQMDDLISTYGMASVADLYGAMGLQDSYTDRKYGWTNLRNAEIVHTRGGYLLKMPRAMLLD